MLGHLAVADVEQARSLIAQLPDVQSAPLAAPAEVGEYKKSLADCDEVLKRNPRHFGALSGLGQIYLQLEQFDESLAWFRKALAVNPNMLGVEFNIKRIEKMQQERGGTKI